MPHGMWGFPYCDIKGEFGICNRDKYVILSDDEERLNRLAQFFSTKTARYLFLATRYRMKLLEKYILRLKMWIRASLEGLCGPTIFKIADTI